MRALCALILITSFLNACATTEESLWTLDDVPESNWTITRSQKAPKKKKAPALVKSEKVAKSRPEKSESLPGTNDIGKAAAIPTGKSEKPVARVEHSEEEVLKADKPNIVSKAAKSPPKDNKADSIVVDAGDMERAEKMTRAMDSFVFKNEVAEFTKLCSEKNFDCLLDEKPFPTTKKKIKRKVPPFMSGSKNGIQGDRRVQVRYDFYP